MRRRTEQLPRGVAGDRRRSKRVKVELECQAVTDDFFLLGDEIVEASVDGVLLRAGDIPALVGETVIVSFRPPRSSEWIDAEAEVVRLITGQRPGAPGFGLELRGLSPFDRERLARSLERYAPRRPRARPRIERARFARPDAVKRAGIVKVAGAARTQGPAADGAEVRPTLVVGG